MQDDHAEAPAYKVRLMVAALAFLSAMAAPTQCQSPQLPPPDRTNKEKVRQQEMSEREWRLRNLATEPEKAANDPRRAQAIMDQVEQDFKRILALHNEFARSLSGSTPLNYNSVSEAAGEIKRRASRLQNTLALPKPDTDEQNHERTLALNETEIRDALTKLCRHIESFIANPIIVTPGTIDANQLTRARRDLERVIEVSDNVRKSVDKLKKTAR